MIRQNRHGHTTKEHFQGFDILTRRGVRNGTDITFSVIITQPAGNGGYFIKHRYAGLKTAIDAENAVQKAKYLIINKFRKPMAKNAEHVVLDPNNEKEREAHLICLHCKEKIILVLPMDVGRSGAIMKFFSKTHSTCKKPADAKA